MEANATDFKPIIIDALTIMMKSDQMSNDPNKGFKVRAYAKIIKQLKALEGPVTGPDNVAGIGGPKIREKFAEIFATGRLASAEHAAASKPIELFDQLLKVHGIGAVKARKLVDAGITSIVELCTRAAAEPKLLDAAQRIGLQYYEEFQERIPREEMEAHDTFIHEQLLAGMQATIVGSYRRGAATSGDIDVLLTMEGADQVATFKAFVAQLQEAGYITEVLALGDHKCMAVCNFDGMPHRRLDLLLTPKEELPFATLYFTGSDTFNVAMRSWALTLGYSLNEHTFSRTGAGGPGSANRGFGGSAAAGRCGKTLCGGLSPPFESEEDIFGFLGLVYVPPQERKGPEQIQALPQIKIKIKRSASK